MIGTKTCEAFKFSVDEFFRWNKQVYFWTFTFIHVPGDDRMAMDDGKNEPSRCSKAKQKQARKTNKV